MSGFSKKTIPSQGTIEIGMEWEWAVAKGRAELITEGLGPCIGIAAYDPKQKIGHMGHFPMPEASGWEDIDELLESIKGYSPSTKHLNLWLRGGSVDIEPVKFEAEPEPLEYSLESRKYMLERLIGTGISESQIDIEWSSSNESVSMTLDCATGVLETEITYIDSEE